MYARDSAERTQSWYTSKLVISTVDNAKTKRDQPCNFIAAAQAANQSPRAPREARGIYRVGTVAISGNAARDESLLLDHGDGLFLLRYDFLGQLGIGQSFAVLCPSVIIQFRKPFIASRLAASSIFAGISNQVKLEIG